MGLVSVASVQKVSEWESQIAHLGVSISFETLKRNVASPESSDQWERNPLTQATEADYHSDPSLLTLSNPVSFFPQSGLLMCID